MALRCTTAMYSMRLSTAYDVLGFPVRCCCHWRSDSHPCRAVDGGHGGPASARLQQLARILLVKWPWKPKLALLLSVFLSRPSILRVIVPVIARGNIHQHTRSFLKTSQTRMCFNKENHHHHLTESLAVGCTRTHTTRPPHTTRWERSRRKPSWR